MWENADHVYFKAILNPTLHHHTSGEGYFDDWHIWNLNEIYYTQTDILSHNLFFYVTSIMIINMTVYPFDDDAPIGFQFIWHNSIAG